MALAKSVKFLCSLMLLLALAGIPALAETRAYQGNLLSCSEKNGNLNTFYSAFLAKQKRDEKLPFKLRGFASPLGTFEIQFDKVSMSDWKVYRAEAADFREMKRPAFLLFSGKIKSRGFGSRTTPRATRTINTAASGLLRISSTGYPEFSLSFSTRGLFGLRYYHAVLSRLGAGSRFRLQSAPSRALSSTSCAAGRESVEQWAQQMAERQNARAFTRQSVSSLNREVELTTDCDSVCLSKMGGDVELANAKIAARVNAVNAVYGSQFGISFKIVAQVVRTSEMPYPGRITDSGKLLDEFHIQAASLPRADISHLVTGRTLDGNVIGLGYSGCGGLISGVTCLCPDFSQSLSTWASDTLSPVIMAHELGHNLGASHDPDNQGIMSPVLGDSSEKGFSPFSQTEITKFVGEFGYLCLKDSVVSGEPGEISSGGENAAEATASLSVSLRSGKFKALASVSAASALSCVVDLKAAYSRAGLQNARTVYYGELVSNKVSFRAEKLPRVSRRSRGASTPIWFSALVICYDGLTVETNQASLSVIAPKKWKGRTVKGRTAWLRALRNAVH